MKHPSLAKGGGKGSEVTKTLPWMKPGKGKNKGKGKGKKNQGADNEY